MSLKYSKKMIEHFENPRYAGELEDADGVGTAGNPVCGDLLTIYLKVENNRIKDLRFKTFGCASAIATTDMICGLALGKTLEEAAGLSKKDVAEALNGLPPIKMHCSNLADQALHAAIRDYETRTGSRRVELRTRKRLSRKGAFECCARNPATSKSAGRACLRTPKK